MYIRSSADWLTPNPLHRAVSEADPMAWPVRINKTKLLNDIRRSRLLARRIDQQKRQATARYSAQQRQAMERARQKLAGDLGATIAQMLGRNMALARQPDLAAIANQVGGEAATEALRYIEKRNAAGLPPTMGGFVAVRFKLAAKRAGWSPAAAELAGSMISSGFDLAASPALQMFVLAISFVLPRAGIRTVGAIQSLLGRLRKSNGEFEFEDMELAA